MEILAGIAISAIVSWFVVYGAVRAAIGDTLMRRPRFRLLWIDRGEDAGSLELEHLGHEPVFGVTVAVPAGDAPVTHPLLEAPMLQPAERMRADVDRDALPPGAADRSAPRVVMLAVRYRPTFEARERQRVELVPVLVGARQRTGVAAPA